MVPFISPAYQLKLQIELKESLFSKIGGYELVKMYLEKWHEEGEWESNFTFYFKTEGNLDVLRTLNSMSGDLLLKIAADIGVATPDYIPSIATFRNEIKTSYETAYQSFEKALKDIYDHPDISVGLTNSALESILKEICKDERLEKIVYKKGTLYDLGQNVLKSLSLYPEKVLPDEIKNIGSGLLTIMKNIEDLRSKKTKLHGLSKEDYVVTDSLLAQFVVNAASTLGIFIINYYKLRFQENQYQQHNNHDDLPF